jgi:5-methylthioadenosine/S-adenosylhomocysteine deaminase
MRRHVVTIRSIRAVLVGAVLAAGGATAVPARQTVSLLVSGGVVLTVDPADDVYAPGAVAIDGSRIVAVGPDADIRSRYAGREVVDATGLVVMPGLVNTHTHAPMVLFRGLADDLALGDWLHTYIFPAEARAVSPEFVRAGARLAALEMIESGTTTFTDMYYFEEEIAKVAREAGLRGVLGETVIEFPSPDARTPAEGLARAERFMREWQGDDLVTPTVAPHSMYTLDAGSLQASRALANRFGAPLLIHLAETEGEVEGSEKTHGRSPVSYLDSLGFWTGRTVAAHAVWVTPRDIAVLAARHVAVSHNPESNMKLASGAAPVTDLRAEHVTVGLGTDGAASNNDLDMFEAMRQASFLQKLRTRDPRAITAREAVAMATIEGARALGLDERLGSLEAGKRADLITVSMAAARQTRMYDPFSHLVYVTRGDDVRTVIVNGRLLMRDRRVLTLDGPAILNEARTLSASVRSAVRPSR